MSKSWWLRVKERPVLLLTLALLAGLVMYVWMRMAAYDHQQEAIEAVRRSGGSVFHSGDAKSWGFPGRLEALFHDIPYGVAFHSPETTDAHLSCLRQLSWLADVRLDGTQVTGAGLGLLVSNPRLAFLSIFGSRISGSDLSVLRTFPSLNTVWLDYDQCTEAAVDNLEHVRGLESISLFCRVCKASTCFGVDRIPVRRSIEITTEFHAPGCLHDKEPRGKLPRGS